MRLLSPRKAGSAWSRVNKDRVARLIASKQMAPAGLAVIARAKEDGSWTRLDAVETLHVPDDLAAAFKKAPRAAATFDAFPRSSKRLILEWIAQAKKPQTRSARVAETVAAALRGKRANHYRQPKIASRSTPRSASQTKRARGTSR